MTERCSSRAHLADHVTCDIDDTMGWKPRASPLSSPSLQLGNKRSVLRRGGSHNTLLHATDHEDPLDPLTQNPPIHPSTLSEPNRAVSSSPPHHQPGQGSRPTTASAGSSTNANRRRSTSNHWPLSPTPTYLHYQLLTSERRPSLEYYQTGSSPWHRISSVSL